jgi:TetR/AcrR family transcriptional regulator, cholesterol catabolism regulator
MAPRKPRSVAGGDRAASTKAVPGSLNGARARDREVIEAAVQIFWDKGYANTSVQDVADALGMLKGSLYYYIDSKERLLEKIFDDSHAELSVIADAASSGEGTAAVRTARFLFDYAMWTLTHVQQAGLYTREWRYASGALKASLADQQRFYDRTLRALIVECQKEGTIPEEVEPRGASLFIWSSFTGLPDWYRPTSKAEARKIASTYVELARRAWGVSSAWADEEGPLPRGNPK